MSTTTNRISTKPQYGQWFHVFGARLVRFICDQAVNCSAVLISPRACMRASISERFVADDGPDQRAGRPKHALEWCKEPECRECAQRKPRSEWYGTTGLPVKSGEDSDEGEDRREKKCEYEAPNAEYG